MPCLLWVLLSCKQHRGSWLASLGWFTHRPPPAEPQETGLQTEGTKACLQTLQRNPSLSHAGKAVFLLALHGFGISNKIPKTGPPGCFLQVQWLLFESGTHTWEEVRLLTGYMVSLFPPCCLVSASPLDIIPVNPVCCSKRNCLVSDFSFNCGN